MQKVCFLCGGKPQEKSKALPSNALIQNKVPLLLLPYKLPH